MILAPMPGPSVLHPLPFQEVPDYLAMSPGQFVVQVGGNLAVFAGFAALAPVRRWQAVAVAAVGSITVESLQYLLDLGRVASVDDVLLNTLGAALVVLIARGRRAKSGATLCR